MKTQPHLTQRPALSLWVPGRPPSPLICPHPETFLHWMHWLVHQARVSQPQCHCQVGPDTSLVGAVCALWAFSRIPGLDPLDTSNIPPLSPTKLQF